MQSVSEYVGLYFFEVCEGSGKMGYGIVSKDLNGVFC